MKTDSNTNFYKYKNGKLYSTCIECFNKKVRCEFCNKELNKSYLRSHIKKQHVQRHIQYAPPQHLQSYAQGYPQSYAQHYAQDFTQEYINIKDSFKCATNDVTNPNDDENDVLQHYSTLIVGPSFCGKNHLLLNKLQLIRLSDSEKQIHIFTRSPEHYRDVGCVGDLVVKEDLGDKSIQDFQNCCVVFDDMLDSNQKLIDPFFTRGRHNLCDVYYLNQSYFEVPKEKQFEYNNFVSTNLERYRTHK